LKHTFEDNDNRLAAAIWSSFVGVLVLPDPDDHFGSREMIFKYKQLKILHAPKKQWTI
jgi:hypothetical protein